jgi:hypothetical protein
MPGTDVSAFTLRPNAHLVPSALVSLSGYAAIMLPPRIPPISGL